MKFAHFADVHIGSWPDIRLSKASTEAFGKAVDACIDAGVDFVLISGDFFNTALPSIDTLKEVTSKLKWLADKGVPVYIIPGSHDFSPTGRTMLDVLENAGLVVNVMRGEVDEQGLLSLRFSVDKKTGAKITGIGGRKGMLDRHFYEHLKLEGLEEEEGFKIFMFHTALEEFKPEGLEQMDAVPLSMFPKGFAYYAGGHIHRRFEKKIDGHGTIVFPGPVFPNSFDELEHLGNGGFYLVEADRSSVTARFNPVVVHSVFSVRVDAGKKTPEEVSAELHTAIDAKEFYNTILLVRVAGCLKSGKPSDVDFKGFFDSVYRKGAVYVGKNSSKLVGVQFEEVKVDEESIENVEKRLISENSGQSKAFPPEKEKELAVKLLDALAKEKEEGETNADFEKRVSEDFFRILGIEP